MGNITPEWVRSAHQVFEFAARVQGDRLDGGTAGLVFLHGLGEYDLQMLAIFVTRWWADALADGPVGVGLSDEEARVRVRDWFADGTAAYARDLEAQLREVAELEALVEAKP